MTTPTLDIAYQDETLLCIRIAMPMVRQRSGVAD